MDDVPKHMTNFNQNRAGWQNAHDLACKSIFIVSGVGRVKKSWPFMAAAAATAALTQAKRGGAAGGVAAASVPPVGNTGGTFLRSVNRG